MALFSELCISCWKEGLLNIAFFCPTDKWASNPVRLVRSLRLSYFTSSPQKTFAPFGLDDEVQKQIQHRKCCCSWLCEKGSSASQFQTWWILLTLLPEKGTLYPASGAHRASHGSEVKHTRYMCLSEHRDKDKLMASSERSLSGLWSMK